MNAAAAKLREEIAAFNKLLDAWIASGPTSADLEDAVLRAQEFARRINNETLRVVAVLKGESSGAMYACTCHHPRVPCHCCPLHHRLAEYEVEVLDQVATMGHELTGRGFADVRHGGRGVHVDDDEAPRALPHREGRCPDCADAGVDTVLGTIWCLACEGLKCARCCGSVEQHARTVEHLEKRGRLYLVVLSNIDAPSGELRFSAHARFEGDPFPSYSVAFCTEVTEALEHLESFASANADRLEGP